MYRVNPASSRGPPLGGARVGDIIPYIYIYIYIQFIYATQARPSDPGATGARGAPLGSA